MNKSNLRRYSQVLVTSLLLLLSIGGLHFFHTKSHPTDANNPEQHEFQSTLIRKPAHSQIYKIGTEANYQDAFTAANKRKQGQHIVRQDEITEEIRIAEEKQAKEKADEEKVKQEQQAIKEAEQLATEKAQQEVTATYENQGRSKNTTQATTTSSTSKSSSSNTTSSNTTAQKQTPAPQKTQAQAAPKVSQPKPAPKPAQPTIGNFKIGINGVYKSYVNYGAASTDRLQGGIDAGQIVAGITSFNGNDGQTTYFGGHNPGIMNFMENNIYNGAVVTITDGNGTPFKYKMIDKVDVDVYGEGVLQSIGRSAIDVYMYGTNTESILIQFCNTSNYLMSFWYGVKI